MFITIFCCFLCCNRRGFPVFDTHSFLRFSYFSRWTDSSKAASSKRSLFSVSSSPAAYSIPSTNSGQSFSDKPSSMTLPTPRSEGEILSSSQLKNFTFNELRNATRNFRLANLLGEGGFGYVYKGWIDEQTFSASRPGCGMVVAVKKLKPQSFQGHKEWLVRVLLFVFFLMLKITTV